jgi:hypothetical protein
VSLMHAAGCCCCTTDCDCLPTSISVSVSAYSAGGISWSAFTAVAYKCCYTNSIYGSGQIYRLEAVPSGLTYISNFGNVTNYLLLMISVGGIGAGQGSITNCDTWILGVTDAFSQLSSDPTPHLCLVPRTFTSVNVCDGLGTDEWCSPPYEPWTNASDSWFKPGNLTNCPACTSQFITSFSNGFDSGNSGFKVNCSFPSSVFQMLQNNNPIFTVAIT